MKRPLIAGNWKMNGTASMAQALAESLVAADLPDTVDVVVCPPFPYLQPVAEKLVGSSIGVGAQNMFTEPRGAFTGEVSAAMLVDCGCSHVIVGHSERRALFDECDGLVADKVAAALAAGLTPILCVGETSEQRARAKTLEVIDQMIDAVAEKIGANRWSDVVIAYEPVWAIGTGETATPALAQQVHAHIRARIRSVSPVHAGQMRILYGGSVKPDNASELLAQPDIDGGLIGGASLNGQDFAAICKAAVKD